MRPARCLSRSLSGAAAIATLALVSSSCGPTRDPLHRVVASAQKTLSISGATYTLRLERPTLFGPSVTVLGGKAAYDFTAGVGYEALTLAGKDGSQQKLFCDFLPATFYLAPSPLPPGALPTGKTWISVAFAGPRRTDAHAELAAQAAGLAPELALDEIAWGARTASFIGSSVVGHVPMDEYRVSVDLAEASSAARGGQRPALAAAITSELRASPTGRVSISVWVNGPGYVQKLETASPGSGLGTASFSFSGFTARFARTLPPADQTVSLASLPDRSRSLWATATGS